MFTAVWTHTERESSCLRNGQLCFQLSLSTAGNPVCFCQQRAAYTYKYTTICKALVSLASVLKFLEWFMFRISSTDRTGNWLGGTVVKGVLSESLDLKYVLPYCGCSVRNVLYMSNSILNYSLVYHVGS